MNERLGKLFNESTKMPIAVGVASFVVGAGVGFGVSYILNRRKIPGENNAHTLPAPIKYNVPELEAIIAKAKTDHQDYLDSRVADENEEEQESLDLVKEGKTFIEEKLEENIEIVPQPEPEPEPVSKSVFAGSDEEWDYEKEQLNRSSSEPYVIHKDEFYADELNYSQITLTYYAGDDIMVDDDDSPVYGYHMITGPLKFGHGSGDPNVVHVRNDKRKAEYEIVRDSGFYSKEVLGLEIENNARVSDLRHSNHVPKFRTE